LISVILINSTLIWKGAEEGRCGSTRYFQSKETILELGGSMLEVSGKPHVQRVLNSK